MNAKFSRENVQISSIAFLVTMFFAPALTAIAEDVWAQDRPVKAKFVRGPAKHSPEWEHYRAMELYYDDLEDHYRFRNRQLSNYYEKFEGYYEDLRKGRRAVHPHAGQYRGAMPIVVPEGVRVAPHREGIVPGFSQHRFSEQVIPQGQQNRIQNSRPLIQSPAPPSSVSKSVVARTPLESSYQQLVGQLSRLSTGVRWQTYLKIPSASSVHSANGDAYFSKLNEAVERYDRIAANPDYRVVAELPAFEPTRNELHNALNGSIASEDGESTLAEPTLAEPEIGTHEEIPLPKLIDPAN